MYVMELTEAQRESTDVPAYPDSHVNPKSPYRGNVNTYKMYGKGTECIGVVSLNAGRNYKGEPDFTFSFTHKVNRVDIVIERTDDTDSYGMEFCEDIIKQGGGFEKIG